MSETISQRDIAKLVPTRYPFLLLDRILEIEPGQRGVGLKNVTVNEPYFVGHFPDEPVMPGVMIIETCAQLVAAVFRSVELLEVKRRDPQAAATWEPTPRVEYIASVERFKFLKPVVPGDQLIVEANVGRRVGQLLQTKVRAVVGKTVVAEGTLITTGRSDPDEDT